MKIKRKPFMNAVIAVNVEAMETLRFQCDFTLKELAEAAGITANALYYIRRTGRARWLTLRRLAKALGVEAKELMEEGL